MPVLWRVRPLEMSRYRLTNALLASVFMTLICASPALTQQTGDGGKRPKRRICVTIDELPAAKSFGDVDHRMITTRILDALQAHEATATGFVVGENIADSYDLLGEWLNRGHALGNLTYSHQDLHDLGYHNFIPDVIAGHEALEPMLAGFGQQERYFRYPFLHYGSEPADKQLVSAFLSDHLYVIAHATVVVEDYLYNLSLEKLGEDADSADYFAIMEEYLNHVVDQIEAAEKLSMKVLQRPCRQILQLRANRLNALALDNLLASLEQFGWEFISLDYALADELYASPEGYTGLRGVGYLEMIEKSDPDLLPAE